MVCLDTSSILDMCVFLVFTLYLCLFVCETSGFYVLFAYIFPALLSYRVLMEVDHMGQTQIWIVHQWMNLGLDLILRVPIVENPLTPWHQVKI